MTIRFKREASAELAAAARWYEARTDGVGTAFLDEVSAAITTIAASPQVWPPWPSAPPGSHLRRFLLSRFPYAIAYRVEGSLIVIFAIAHTKRRHEYWLGRTR